MPRRASLECFLLDVPPLRLTAPHQSFPTIPFVLTVREVGKRYTGVRVREVLRNVCLEVPRGGFVAIMGESGAGKSTLLNLIAGLDVPDEGSITIEGVELSTLDESSRTVFRRDRLGFVFQAFHLLPHLTVEQNVRLPLDLSGIRRELAMKKTAAILDAVGIARLRKDYPRTLSGGEAQRTAIARALVHEPAVLLADEPTGNLDAQSAMEVLDVLRRSVKARAGAGVLVTHSEQAARAADRILMLTSNGLEPHTL